MYHVEEFSDLWVDACLRNSEGRLLFMSVYGRDTSVMQFLSALELGSSHDKGVDQFYLVGGMPHQRHRVDVVDTKRLGKHSVRLPRQNLFGPMSQMWLYDKALQQLDRANGIAWVMEHRVRSDGSPTLSSELDDKVWQTVIDLSPVALLPHWRIPVMSWCAAKRAVAAVHDDLYPALGPIQAVRISLSPHFVAFVSGAVREGVLTLDP